MTGSDRMKINRLCSVIAMLGVILMALAIAGLWYENRIRRRGNVQGYAVADS